MDHDHRRVHAPLVRISHFGPEHPGPLGTLKLNSLQQQAGEHRRGHFAGGCPVGLGNRRPKRAQPLTLLGRNEVQRSKLQERESRLNGAL